MSDRERSEGEVSRVAIVFRALGMLAAEGASLGLAFWTLRAGDPLIGYVATNALAPAPRAHVVGDLLGGALAGIALGLALLAWKRAAGVDLLHRMAFRLAPLVVAWLPPLLLHWNIWKDRELEFLTLAGIFGAGFQRMVRLSLVTPPLFTRPLLPAKVWRLAGDLADRRWARALPLAVVIAASAAYAFFFAFHTIRNHYRLGTASLDLGLENNLVWNAVHWGPLFKTSPLGGPDASHAGYHQTYFTYLIGIPYRLAPRPETLLVIQAIFMGGAAIPLYLLARRRLSAWVSCLIALLYLLYPPLHGANLYDFHYLPLGTFFLWTTLYLLEQRRYGWAVLAVLLTLSVREDISALLVFVGAYLLLVGERPVAGLVTIVVGAAYFVSVKLVLMPRFLSGGESFIHQYAGLLPEGERGYGGVLKTVFANPGFTVGTVLDPEKLVYMLQIIVPLAFLPWRRPIGLLCTMPGFLFTLLATKYPPLIQASFQYTAYWSTFLFIAIVANLAWLQREERAAPTPTLARGWSASRRAWLVALTGAMLVTSYQFGAILQQNTMRGGFGPFRFTLTQEDRDRHDRLYRLIARVPKDAKIVSSEMIVPHVSSRRDSYTMRYGLWEAEYFLASLPPRGDEQQFIAEALKSGRYGVIDEQGEFVLAQAGYSTVKNAAVIARYHL